MASDLQWVPHFCLTCDTQTDGAAYCSESCRLADYEDTSSTGLFSDASSPSWSAAAPSYQWTGGSNYSTGGHSSGSRKMYLSPAYDFAHAQPYGSTPSYHGSGMASTASGSTYYHSTPRRPVAASTASGLYSSVSAAPASSATTAVTYQHVLSPSSSHSSLSSMRSTSSSCSSSAMDALTALHAFAGGLAVRPTHGDLSDKTRSELRKYASSLEQGKLQRRRSC